MRHYTASKKARALANLMGEPPFEARSPCLSAEVLTLVWHFKHHDWSELLQKLLRRSVVGIRRHLCQNYQMGSCIWWHLYHLLLPHNHTAVTACTFVNRSFKVSACWKLHHLRTKQEVSILNVITCQSQCDEKVLAWGVMLLKYCIETHFAVAMPNEKSQAGAQGKVGLKFRPLLHILLRCPNTLLELACCSTPSNNNMGMAILQVPVKNKSRLRIPSVWGFSGQLTLRAAWSLL